ncbi:hypothetical protein DZC31_30945 (plasmid) [Stenotrophomonas rhizophila]|nr:hypothetical protein DZC31_30945 [Stenotrophomonas rhizophila]
MPSLSVNPLGVGRAERAFREAFERLKNGKPERLPYGTPVSQNNVARETGSDPSALKKSRYPELINDIQTWINEHNIDRSPSARKKALALRKRKRSLQEVISDLKSQRDSAASLLVEADAKILELTIENSRLQAMVHSASVNQIRKPKA